MRGRRREKTEGVAYYTRPPQARQDALLPELCSWLENPQRTDGKEPVLAGSGLGG
jgi:hypothetical protein